MENVKGILSSRINGDLIFHHILDDLEQAGYRIHSLVKTRQPDSRTDPHDFVICSEQCGIPWKDTGSLFLVSEIASTRNRKFLTQKREWFLKQSFIEIEFR
jgi:hypothetical protein